MSRARVAIIDVATDGPGMRSRRRMHVWSAVNATLNTVSTRPRQHTDYRHCTPGTAHSHRQNIIITRLLKILKIDGKSSDSCSVKQQKKARPTEYCTTGVYRTGPSAVARYR